MWDKFKGIDSMDKLSRVKLGHLLSHLLVTKALSISIFKVSVHYFLALFVSFFISVIWIYYILNFKIPFISLFFIYYILMQRMFFKQIL